MNETLSFIRENTKKGLTIPPTALMVSGIDGQPLEYRTLPGAIVAFKRSMTAMELIDTIHALNRCASELFDVLVETAGKCDGCDEQCDLLCDIPVCRRPRALHKQLDGGGRRCDRRRNR